MSFTDPGSAEGVFDVVRGMIIADSMESVTLVAQIFLNSSEVRVVLIKVRRFHFISV